MCEAREVSLEVFAEVVRKNRILQKSVANLRQRERENEQREAEFKAEIERLQAKVGRLDYEMQMKEKYLQESIRENLLLRTGTSVLVNESRQKPVASAIPVDVLKEINSRVWVSRRKIKSIINAYVQENFSLRVALEDLLGNETVNRIRLNEIKKENSEDLQLLQKLLQLKSGEAESLKLENAQLQESLAQTKQKQCLNCLREKRINVHRDGLILPENKRTAMREDELELSYKGKSEKIDENDLLVEIGRLEQTILNRDQDLQDLNKQLEHLQVEQDAIIQERDCCQSRLQNYEIVLKKFPVIQLIEAEGESSKRFPTIISSVLILSSKQLVLNILNSAMNSWIGFNEIQSFCAEQQVGNTFEITMEHRRSLRFQTIDVPSGDYIIEYLTSLKKRSSEHQKPIRSLQVEGEPKSQQVIQKGARDNSNSKSSQMLRQLEGFFE